MPLGTSEDVESYPESGLVRDLAARTADSSSFLSVLLAALTRDLVAGIADG